MNLATMSRYTVDLPAGLRLHYTTAGTPGAPPVFLLHGFTDSAFSYSPIMPLLADHAQLFALDQRGHGESDRPAQGYAMADFAADAIALIDALQLERVIVVGHSMGASVAQEIALTAPDRLAGLVLISGAANARNVIGIDELHAAVQELPDPVPSDFIREFQVSCAYQPLDETFLQQVIAESSRLPAYVWRGVLAGLMSADTTSRLHTLQMPTLLLWGDQDTYFPFSEQEVFRQSLPNATLKVYAETGHALHWERPEQAAADLRAFFERCAR